MRHRLSVQNSGFTKINNKLISAISLFNFLIPYFYTMVNKESQIIYNVFILATHKLSSDGSFTYLVSDHEYSGLIFSYSLHIKNIRYNNDLFLEN